MRIHLTTFLFLITLCYGCTQKAGQSYSGFEEPANPESADIRLWDPVPEQLQAGFGSTDYRYKRDVPPEGDITTSWSGTGWKGERMHAQFLLWSTKSIEQVSWLCSDLINKEGHTIPGSAVTIRAVRYVLSDGFLTGCGYRDKDTIQAHLVGDILEPVSTLTIAARTTRPLWLSIEIPADAFPGTYSGNFEIKTARDSLMVYNLEIRVQNHLLPQHAEWTFHLDLWQNPYAVARFHKVPLWSETHWEALKELLVLLAEAGQKCITTSIIQEPWGGQTYDPFGSMIGWIRNASGKWEFDYSIFDQYVQLAMKCGITKQINCYAMVPWGNKLGYFDEDSSGFISVEVVPGTPAYEDLWRPFLFDFRAHLKEMGWLGITTLALDERGIDEMKELLHFLEKTAPEFRITMAGHYFEEINDQIYDFSYNWRHISPGTSDRILERRKQDQISTYYVACGIPQPNTFTFSPPAEAAWIGWYAAAMGFDGFLRWAYNSWVEDPLMDTRFRSWPAGDTYLVYPGPRSSIRFERLREGIQDYEKIRILLEPAKKNPEISNFPDSLDLDQYLVTFTPDKLKKQSAASMVNKGKKILAKLSEYFE